MPSDLSVDEIGALRRDARMWGGGGGSMAETMRAAAATAASLQLTPAQLSWAGIDAGLPATYAELTQKVARLLGEAAANFEAVATSLDRAADAYEGVELENAAELRKAWQLREH